MHTLCLVSTFAMDPSAAGRGFQRSLAYFRRLSHCTSSWKMGANGEEALGIPRNHSGRRLNAFAHSDTVMTLEKSSRVQNHTYVLGA